MTFFQDSTDTVADNIPVDTVDNNTALGDSIVATVVDSPVDNIPGTAHTAE